MHNLLNKQTFKFPHEFFNIFSEYVAIAVSRIDKIGRLFYNPRFGKENIINAPIVAVRIIAADDKETFPKNVSHVKMRLTFTDVSTATVTITVAL